MYFRIFSDRMFIILTLLIRIVFPAIAQEVVIDFPADIEKVPAGFEIAHNPYVLGNEYLMAKSPGSGAEKASVQIEAPEGDYFVYIAWVREPKFGASFVTVRMKGRIFKIDQHVLANGLYPWSDMIETHLSNLRRETL